MKEKIIIFLIGLLIMSNLTLAQKLSKEERKAYRKRGTELKKEFKKNYKDTNKFLELKNDSLSTKKKVDSLTTEVLKMKAKQQASTNTLEQLRKEEEETQEKIKELEQLKIAASKTRAIPTKGTFFAVQISNFTAQDIFKILETQPTDFNIQKDDVGKDIYILGLYDNPAQAQELRRYISQMGIRKSLIIIIKDGRILKPDEVKKLSKQ